jgi:hypothetical protein
MLAEAFGTCLPAGSKNLEVLDDPQSELKALPNFRLSQGQLRDPRKRATPHPSGCTRPRQSQEGVARLQQVYRSVETKRPISPQDQSPITYGMVRWRVVSIVVMSRTSRIEHSIVQSIR